MCRQSIRPESVEGRSPRWLYHIAGRGEGKKRVKIKCWPPFYLSHNHPNILYYCVSIDVSHNGDNPKYRAHIFPVIIFWCVCVYVNFGRTHAQAKYRHDHTTSYIHFVVVGVVVSVYALCLWLSPYPHRLFFFCWPA